MDYYIQNIDIDTTLDEIINADLSIFRTFKNRKKELLAYSVNGVTNYDNIVALYTKEDMETMGVEGVNLVRAGTDLYLPKSELDLDLVSMIGRGQFIEDCSSFEAYYGNYLDLLKDDTFAPALRDTNYLHDIDMRQYEISVWIWSRAWSRDGVTLLNITPWVESLSTNADGTNNGFTIQLQNPTCDRGDLSLDSVFRERERIGDDVLTFSNIGQRVGTSIRRGYNLTDMRVSETLPVSVFSTFFQRSDLVFIRFEKLLSESDLDRQRTDVEVSSSELPGKIFDMIGVVDDVLDTFSFSNIDSSLSLKGRDLMSLLVEDMAIFYPLMFVENSDALFFDAQDDSKWFKRNFITKSFENLFVYKMLPIKESIGFIINQLANLGICNDQLFSFYDTGKEGLGKRRVEVMNKDLDSRVSWNTVSGVWQIIDVLVDPQIEDRRVASSPLSSPSGSLLGLIESVCQDPFVEFFGDTYGDKFTMIARQPPYTREAIRSVLDRGHYIELDLRDIDNYTLQWEQAYYTYYQLDPQNMFLGKSQSIALAYVPVVYFPEIAEAFGNKQLNITDSYISNKAFTGIGESVNRDEFKNKVVEDFVFVINSYCYLPFTKAGTIVCKRDRRIKARTWVKVDDMFYYVTQVQHTFAAVNEMIDGSTILTVSRGMKIDYIRGKYVNSIGRVVSYWDIVKLDKIKRVLLQKLNMGTEEGDVSYSTSQTSTKISFGTDPQIFDFFLQRRFMYE